MLAFLKFQVRDSYGDVHFEAGAKIKVKKVSKDGDKKSWYTNEDWTFPRSALTIPRKKKK